MIHIPPLSSHLHNSARITAQNQFPTHPEHWSPVNKLHLLTLRRVQHPKMSTRGHGQNIPKRPVKNSKLCYFHTRKFPYNLMRIFWIITVQDFCYFPRTIFHCLCVQSESERVFVSRVEETRCRFSRWISSMIQTTTNESLAFTLKTLCFEKHSGDSDSDVNEVSSVHTSDWSNWQQRWLGWRYCDRNRWSRRTRLIDDRFTVRICHNNWNKHRSLRSKY